MSIFYIRVWVPKPYEATTRIIELLMDIHTTSREDSVNVGALAQNTVKTRTNALRTLPFHTSPLTLNVTSLSSSPEPTKVKPLLNTDTPLCPQGQLACGNGVCLSQASFCDGIFDCEDNSDENACSEYIQSHHHSHCNTTTAYPHHNHTHNHCHYHYHHHTLDNNHH